MSEYVQDGTNKWFCKVDRIASNAIQCTMSDREGFLAVVTGASRTGAIHKGDEVYNIALPGTERPGPTVVFERIP